MPRIRYWEITRYYHYIAGEKHQHRGFELRVTLPFPEAYTEDDVAKEAAKIMDDQFDMKMREAFKYRELSGTKQSQLDRFLRELDGVGNKGFGVLVGDFRPTKTGFEPSRTTEFIETPMDVILKIRNAEQRLTSTRQALGDVRTEYPVLQALPFVASESASYRRQLVGRTGGLARAGKYWREERLPKIEPVETEFTMVDKNTVMRGYGEGKERKYVQEQRYPDQIKEGALKFRKQWEIPEKKKE